MKPGDIVRVAVVNAYYNIYLNKYAIVESVYSEDNQREICNIRIFIPSINFQSITHINEKAYAFRLVVVS